MILKVDENGSPLLDNRGRLIEITGIKELKQRILDVFRTQVGSDLLLPQYGFDLLVAGELHGEENTVAYMIKPLVAEALDPNLLVDVEEVNSIEVTVSGGIITAEIGLTRTNGETLTEDLKILESD